MQRQVISAIYLCVGIFVTCSKMCIVAGLTKPGDMLRQQGQHGYGPQQAGDTSPTPQRLSTDYFLEMHANQKTVDIPKAGVEMVRAKGVYLLRPACTVAVSAPPPRQCVYNSHSATSASLGYHWLHTVTLHVVGMVNPGVSELVGRSES